MPDIDEKNLVKIKKLLAIVDEDTLTRAEFTDNFSKIIELVAKIQEQQAKAIDDLERTYANLLNRVDSSHQERFNTLKGQVNNLFVDNQLKRMDSENKANFGKLEKFVNEIMDKKLQEADDRVSKLQPIKGDKGDKGDIGPMPTEHLELMRELRGELKKVQNVLSNIPRGKGMGRAKIQIIRSVNLTSQVNGTTSAFTLPPDTVQVLGVWGTQFPVNFNQDADWTFSGRTLTLVTAQVGIPQNGQTLWALCEVLFYP